MITTFIIICAFTFTIHMTECLAYTMRLSGLRTRQIAISMSFVTSTLIISRLSNMFQAPLLGAMADKTALIGTQEALHTLVFQFRINIFAAFLGALAGALMTPTMVTLFQQAILRFLRGSSIPRIAVSAFKPHNLKKIIRSLRLPRLKSLNTISIRNIPKTFLIMNLVVTSIYTIGVLCALLASAHLPEFRATALQLSGIVNGIATIMLTLFVDPAGARITDQAYHNSRPQDDVRSVVFYLQFTKILGNLILAQLLLLPFTWWIMWWTQLISHTVH